MLEKTFMERTSLIINKMDSKLVKDKNKHLLRKWGYEVAKPGFHDLYVKCKFYEVLLNKLNNEVYLKLSMKDKVLVQLLLSPDFENKLLNCFQKENLVDLIAYLYPTTGQFFLHPSDDPLASIGSYLLDESALPFDSLKKSIAGYCLWYEKNAGSLYCNQNDIFITTADLDPNTRIYFDKLSIYSASHDVGAGLCGTIKLENGQFLGAAGLSPSVGILAIFVSNGHTYTVLRHIIVPNENCIQWDKELYEAKGYSVNFYLIGGEMLELGPYLDAISCGLPITDVRLLSKPNTLADCVCFCDGDRITVGYRAQLTHSKILDDANSEIIDDDFAPTPKHSGDESYDDGNVLSEVAPEIIDEEFEGPPNRNHSDDEGERKMYSNHVFIKAKCNTGKRLRSLSSSADSQKETPPLKKLRYTDTDSNVNCFDSASEEGNYSVDENVNFFGSELEKANYLVEDSAYNAGAWTNDGTRTNRSPIFANVTPLSRGTDQTDALLDVTNYEVSSNRS